MKPLPIRPPAAGQNWDCQACGNCCRDYQVGVTDAERARIEAQDWGQDPAIAGQPLFVRKSWRTPVWRLNHRADGACIFLDPEGRCRIHAKFGADAKPLACRLYPFVLIPVGDHWHVGLRYACPSAAANRGRALADHRLEGCAAELAQQAGDVVIQPPPLQRGQHVEWSDLLRIVDTLSAILSERRFRIERRVRLCLALARECRKARFDTIQGSRLSEFLQVLRRGLEGDLVDGTALPPPSWVGRVLFRQLLALYTRKDQGQDVGPMRRSRLALLAAACRFALGRGQVPRGHAWIPEITFARLEAPAGELPEDAEQALERYFTLKVESLQFCGSTNSGMSFWEGFESLALTLPVILWVARAQLERSRLEAVVRAITMVDHNFGFNPILGSLRQRFGLQILAQRGELDRLIGWYSR